MEASKALVIIPTYNEKPNIGLLIPEILRTVPGISILVVDDNSPDGTAQVVKELQATTPTVHLLERPGKQGLGRAYIAGFRWALERDFACVFEMDADFSHDPRYLPDFLKAIDDADLVIGSRYVNGVNVVNWPMSRLLLSYGGNMYARFVAGIPIHDCTGGFKCFRREVLERVNWDQISSSGYSFQIEVNYTVWKLGMRLREVSIIFADRTRGQSKMSTGIIREALFLLWRLRFRPSRRMITASRV